MRIAVLVLAACLSSGTWASAQTRVNAGISIDEDGRRSFYLAIGDYYRVPEREVIVVRERAIPDDDLPVVFFLASRAHVEPGVIVDLRLRGMSWSDITFHFGLGPEVYYVPVRTVDVGPPYGRAYGHYKKVPRAKWHQIHLEDSDIVNLVNLRFVSDHRGVPASEVMRMRKDGRPFTTIYRESHTRKGGPEAGAVKGDGHGRGGKNSGGDKNGGHGKGRG